MASAWLSTASAMALRPLSTYTTLPVIADASGDTRKAAAAPTSLAASSFWIGALAYEYLPHGWRLAFDKLNPSLR